MLGTDRTISETSASEDLQLLDVAAREAGDVALRFFRNDPKTWYKNNKSPVSEADLAVNRHLLECLSGARPSYGVLSEESEDDPGRMTSARTFVIDPIDGTRAFLAGRDEWTVALAVVEGGRPIAGAVYCPVREEMYLARQGGGAWLNEARIVVSLQEEVDGARLCGPRSLLENPGTTAAGFVPLPFIGSLAHRLAVVAAGRADVAAAHHGAHDWDLAAADILVQEAGGIVTDLGGQHPMYNRSVTRHPALVATSRSMIGPACAAVGDLFG